MYSYANRTSKNHHNPNLLLCCVYIGEQQVVASVDTSSETQTNRQCYVCLTQITQCSCSSAAAVSHAPRIAVPSIVGATKCNDPLEHGPFH